ncbi:MAG: alpha/beta fold hydrolase [Pyrinomonadaceae bacterium]
MRSFSNGFLLFMAITWFPVTALAAPSLDRAIIKSDFIKVNGVKLHYLDWGGKGKAILFLAGAGHSAYIFSDLAPQLTDRFRVLGLTRRGHGQSEQPAIGYDTATLVEDIRQFLTALKIKRVTLIGHSMAGDEMTHFAGLYPERIDKLVYLDAAYDRSQISEGYLLSSLAETFALLAPTKQDFASVESWRNWLQHKRYGFWSAALEADMQQTIKITPQGIRSVMSDEVVQALARGTETFHPDFTKVKAPAPSFYAVTTMATFFWLNNDSDPQIRQKTQSFLDTWLIPNQRKQIERFKQETGKGKVIEMPGVSHFLFIQKQPEVVREIRAFLLKKG